MLRTVFPPTIRVSERVKTFRAFDRAAAVICINDMNAHNLSKGGTIRRNCHGALDAPAPTIPT
jgi:hypothetical protein